MANLGLIDFKIGLYIKVNVKMGKTNVESGISQNILPKWPLIGTIRSNCQTGAKSSFECGTIWKT